RLTRAVPVWAARVPVVGTGPGAAGVLLPTAVLAMRAGETGTSTGTSAGFAGRCAMGGKARAGGQSSPFWQGWWGWGGRSEGLGRACARSGEALASHDHIDLPGAAGVQRAAAGAASGLTSLPARDWAGRTRRCSLMIFGRQPTPVLLTARGTPTRPPPAAGRAPAGGVARTGEPG